MDDLQHPAPRASGLADAFRQSIYHLAGQRLAQTLPPEQAAAFGRLLDQLQQRSSLPDLAQAAGQAGLNQPLPPETLAMMGVASEQALLRRGLGDGLLNPVRSIAALYAMAPRDAAPGFNYIPYGILMGYLYEALMASHFHRLYRHLRLGKAGSLAAYDRVEWSSCTAFAACPLYLTAEMLALSPEDWAVWLNLLQCCRQLRNRLHSDDGEPGFLSRAELDAFYALFFARGASPKLDLLALPCFAADAPPFGKPVWPVIPAEWSGAAAQEPRSALQRHIRLRAPSFRLSLLDFLLACADLALPEEEAPV